MRIVALKKVLIALAPNMNLKIKDIKTFFRYVVASRLIKAGEVIFEDIPIGIGPNQETSPICLSCNSKVYHLQIIKKIEFRN